MVELKENYLNLSRDFTNLSSFFMALLAKKMIGKKQLKIDTIQIFYASLLGYLNFLNHWLVLKHNYYCEQHK